MTEVTVGDNVYRVGQLSALDAYHVARKFAPVLFVLAAGQDAKPEGAAKAIVTMSSKLENAEADFVVAKCLSICSRKQQSGYAPVMASGQLMFTDLGLLPMMQLVYHALEANGLTSFFAEPPSEAGEEKSPPSSS